MAARSASGCSGLCLPALHATARWLLLLQADGFAAGCFGCSLLLLAAPVCAWLTLAAPADTDGGLAALPGWLLAAGCCLLLAATGWRLVDNIFVIQWFSCVFNDV